MRSTPRAIVALLGLVAALALAACGSDGSSSSTTKAASSGPFVSAQAAAAFKQVTGLDAFDKPATKAELETRIAKYEAVPTKLLEDQPVSKKAQPGKTIALLVCGVPVCAEFNEAAKEAADVLGWKTVRIDLGTSPEDFANAYNRAIELKPDLVVGSGLARELFDKQLKTLASMKIPVIEWSSGIKPVAGQLWATMDDPLYEAAGIQAAEFIAADGDMKSNVAVFNVPQYTMSTLVAKTLASYLPKVCSGCTADYQVAAATDIGKLGPTVTGYVQQHPNTKYVFCSFGDLCQGVGQALKTAGRSDVKVFTRDPGTTNLQNMASGSEWATSPLPIGQTGWQIIDLAQRIFNGDDTSKTRLAPLQIVSKVTDPKSPLVGAVPDYKEQYKALWKVAG